MPPRRTLCWAGHFLLFVGLFWRVPLAAGQELPRPPQSPPTPDVRSPLLEGVRDSTLAPWQREFMLKVARARAEGVAVEPSPALPGIALSPAAIAASDGAWSTILPAAGTLPAGRYLHAAIYDPVRDRMLVFGGDGGSFRNDVWALSLSGNPVWSALAPAGIPPTARVFTTAIYDPVRDRMLLFGGNSGSYRNDVWALSLSGSPAWSALTPTGTPPSARYAHSAIYDPVRDRMLVFGGFDASFRNDVWALSLSGSPAWSALTPVGTPPSARYAHSAIYDPVRDRMLAFGGFDDSFRNDVWALSLSGSPAWSTLTPAGTPPTGRVWHTAVYDPVRDRMVVFGGGDFFGLRNDAGALALAGSPAWSALAPAGTLPSTRYGHTAIHDPVRDRMVVFGGDDGASYGNDLWALDWSPTVSVPGDGISLRFALAPPRPNPSRGETVVEFDLREPARVVLDVFDTQGRRVKQIAADWFTAGRHTSMWRGDDESGHALGGAVYFVRMQVGGVQAMRRTVRIR